MKIDSLSKRRFLKLSIGAGFLIPGLAFWCSSEDFRSDWQIFKYNKMMNGTPLQNSKVAMRKEGGETIIYTHQNRTELLKINETAATVFNMCDGKHVVRDIVATLSSRFDVPASECLKDVIFTLDIFRKYGIVTL